MRFTFTFYVGRKTITLGLVVKARTATLAGDGSSMNSIT